ncbi:MAG: hypothetical protein ACRD2E_12435 [Terriglobales bacterium]
MPESLGHYFKTVGHDLLALERGVRAAQPVLAAATAALGGGGFLNIEELCVSILGDLIDAARDLQSGRPEAAVTLGVDTVADVRRLTDIVSSHPEAPAPRPGH